MSNYWLITYGIVREGENNFMRPITTAIQDTVVTWLLAVKRQRQNQRQRVVLLLAIPISAAEYKTFQGATVGKEL